MSSPVTFHTVVDGSDSRMDINKTMIPRVPSPLLGGEINFNMLNVSSSRPRSRSASMKKPRHKTLDVFDECDGIRPRTSSLPTKNTYRKPVLGSLRFSTGEYCEDQEDLYRLRTFELTSKGEIINRGDSLRSRSTNSVLSSGSDIGALSRTSSSLSQSSVANSTCSGSTPLPFRVLVVGGARVGKTALIQQFTTSEYLGGFDTSIDSEEEKTISVLLDGSESSIEFIDQTPGSHWSCKENVDGYMVVFSLDDRRTFDVAVDTLYKLRKEDKKDNATILVASKCDLVRSRAVTTEEAVSVAKTYDSKFVETSTVLNHNVDELLVGILSQIRLKQKQLEKYKGRHDPTRGCIPKGKALLNKIFRKEDMAKSCENLYVL